MFDLAERPGAFNIQEVLIHNHSDVTGIGPVVINTPPQRWAYAASFTLKDDPQDPLADHSRLLIRVDATLEQGEIGMSAANPETGDALSKEDRKAAPGRATFEILLESPRAGTWLVFRNAAGGGTGSRVVLENIHAFAVHASFVANAGQGPTESSGTQTEHFSDLVTVSEIWIDVGAHLGQETFPVAAENPRTRVYAFEPNLRIAARTMGQLANYIVLPFAISEQDGRSPFYINRFSASSSLLPMEAEGVKHWLGGEVFEVEQTVTVPTMRLDTFLNEAGIEKVDYLKVDTQGGDLAVLRSAGERLRDIQRIKLEVQISQIPLYRGACTKEEVIVFLTSAGFEMISSEKQARGQEENLTFVRQTS